MGYNFYAMTPEPTTQPKTIEETRREFDEAMERQGFEAEVKDTSTYGKAAVESGKPYADED